MRRAKRRDLSTARDQRASRKHYHLARISTPRALGTVEVGEMIATRTGAAAVAGSSALIRSC